MSMQGRIKLGLPLLGLLGCKLGLTAALPLAKVGRSEGLQGLRRELVGVTRPLAYDTVGDPRCWCGRRIRAIESGWEQRGSSALSLLTENGTHLMHGRASRKMLRKRRCIRLASVACPAQLAHIELRTESGRHGRMHRSTGVKA